MVPEFPEFKKTERVTFLSESWPEPYQQNPTITPKSAMFIRTETLGLDRAIFGVIWIRGNCCKTVVNLKDLRKGDCAFP